MKTKKSMISGPAEKNNRRSKPIYASEPWKALATGFIRHQAEREGLVKSTQGHLKT